MHACHTGQLVIFAGAGVSTESEGVYPTTFYHWIKDELNLPKEKKISFSNLMSLYCSSPRNRKDLLLSIKGRFDYVRSFPELYQRATEFHRELSTIPFVSEIFTTNWDDFFERECDATPIVTGQDFAILQDIPGRKVFKLHGSIYNYGSIVATKEDYRNCYKRLSTGIIGAKLKLLLMSKTIVFVGFSFEDEDFQRLYRLLSKEVGGLIPCSYVVTLDEQAKEKLDPEKINATPIITSGAFFMKKLKGQLIKDNFMLPDQQYDDIDKALEDVLLEHAKLSSLGLIKHPDSFYSLVYQDGLQHAFDRLLSTKNSGQNSDSKEVIDTIESYDDLIKTCLHEGNYPDVAYFSGYKNGLTYFLADKKQRQLMPMYFLFGCGDIRSFEQYIKLEKDAAGLHKSAHELAKKIASKVSSERTVFHRSPFL